MTDAPPSRGFLFAHLLGCSAFWASGFLFIKLSGGAVPPLAIAAMRGLIGAAALGLLFAARREAPLPQGREWRDWAVLGCLNGWLPNMLVAFALTQIATGSASMIQASGPLIVAVLSHMLFADERLTPLRALGVLVGFVGMGILIGPDAFGGVNATGAFAMVVVAACYAIGNVYVRLIPKAEPARLAIGQQIFSGIPATILALAILGPAAFSGVPDRVLPLLALGVLATAIPILLFMRLIRRAGPTRASMVGYLQPVWATSLALVFLSETLGARELLGGAVVLAGVALVSTTGRR